MANVALNKTVTGSIAPLRPELAVDGQSGNTDQFTELGDGPQWLQIDLGETYWLTQIKMWHYYGDNRTYHDVIVELSTDATTWTAVFNNDADNSAGRGVGADAEYAETAAGKTVDFGQTSARYVRLWTWGNSINIWNHYVEVMAEAWTPAYHIRTPDEVFAGEHTVVTRVDVCKGGEKIVEGLPVIAGRVDFDGAAKHRGRCTLTIVDEDLALLPLRSSDPLSPYGHELSVHRGAVIDGVDTLWPLGIYRIDDSSWSYDASGIVVTVEGYDRSIGVSDAKLSLPVTFKVGRNYGSAIARLLDIAQPGYENDFATVNEAVAELLLYDAGSDPWDAVAGESGMAEMVGMELFYDVNGRRILRPVPEASPESVPVVTYRDGVGGTLVGVGGTMSTRPGYNRFVVTSAGLSTAPVRWRSDDRNPASPTNGEGPYGWRTLVVRDEKVGTQQQAKIAARGMLAKRLGGTEHTTIRSWVDPRRQPGEIIRVEVDRVGYERTAVIERVSMGLAYSDTMEITTKARYTVIDEAAA